MQEGNFRFLEDADNARDPGSLAADRFEASAASCGKRSRLLAGDSPAKEAGMAESIPTIDVGGDPDALAREVDETLRQVGFFQIVGHGVPTAVADRCWSVTRAFFDLPLADKLAVASGPRGDFGYFPMASESLAASRGSDAPADLKESFNAARDQAVWPIALPEMQEAWQAYFGAMLTLSEHLMSIFARALDLRPDYFSGKVDRGPSALRAINYPEQPSAPAPGQLRAGAHTDYGTLTILRQESGRPGLQVFDEKGSGEGAWVDIPPVDGAFVINIGDLMARWTNDRWTSTLHRVVNPDAGAGGVSTRRQSMPFFHNANDDAVVECLPSALAQGESPRYEPVAAGEWLRRKVGLAKTAS
jgi:isopenicillin N synthase-like dioxygenase